VWCDPCAWTPDGIARALVAWAREFPAARLYVLQDGYAGPLFGLDLGGAEIDLDEATASVVVLAGRAAECIATADAIARSAPTLNSPALEWEASSTVSPFPLPDGDVLASIASVLTTPKSELAGELFRVLELHSRAQVDRPSFHTRWDRVRIEKPEIDAALALLRRRPDFEPAARAVANIGDVLYEKRDYDVLFDLLGEAIRLRPDVARLHLLLGRVRHELLDSDGAVAEYELARSLDPASTTIESELAHIYAEQGRWQLAAPLLEAAWAATSAPDPLIAKALGLAYVELGRWSDARRLLDFAWQQSPGDIEIRRAFDRLDAQKH
jgi:tetratricopeptide (TPR) repeat protein